MSLPVFQKEGPASACILHGRYLGWTLCTCLSAGMGMDQATNGHIRIDGCQIRDETGDYIGGTSLEQMQTVCAAHGVKTELHVGANVCAPFYAGYHAGHGRGFILQGNTLPDGRGNVNHAVWVAVVVLDANGNPVKALVYDPWSNGPAWWSWSKVLTFAAALRPWGESDPRTLGPGKFYCLMFPTSPPPATVHTVHLSANARIRSYVLDGACIKSWTDTRWVARPSAATCEAPVHRKTCDGKSAATTVRITSGAYYGHHIQINPPSVTVT